MHFGNHAFRGGLNSVQKTGVRFTLWILTAAMCILIFAFSSQDGDTSMQTSGWFAEPIARILVSLAGEKASFGYQDMLDVIQVAVRKTAHFTEYAVLGGLVFLLHASYGMRHQVLPAWLITALYAAGDELHQYLTGSRTGMWQDVVLDACGALAGILVCRAVLANRTKKKAAADHAPEEGIRQ